MCNLTSVAISENAMSPFREKNIYWSIDWSNVWLAFYLICQWPVNADFMGPFLPKGWSPISALVTKAWNVSDLFHTSLIASMLEQWEWFLYFTIDWKLGLVLYRMTIYSRILRLGTVLGIKKVRHSSYFFVLLSFCLFGMLLELLYLQL